MAVVIESGLASSSSGADSFVSNDLIATGVIIWVDSVNGNDANSGTESNPLATLAQAITNATANNGDIIALKNGHSETLTGAITINKAGLKIFGIGNGSDAPNFTVNATGIDGIDVTAPNVELNNLYFPAGTTATNNSRINVGASNCKIKSCTFLCGAYDQWTITIPDAGDYANIESCSFTVSADGPDAAVHVESASADGLRIYNCSFNGSTYNWDLGAIYSAVAHTNFLYDTVTLTNEAAINHTAAAKGVLSNTIAGEGSLVTT